MKESNPNRNDANQFKGSPAPDKGQAIESGEPTLTGSLKEDEGVKETSKEAVARKPLK